MIILDNHYNTIIISNLIFNYFNIYFNYHILFEGKVYVNIVKKISNISLYKDLEFDELKSLYEKIDNFIEKNSSLELE